MNKDGSKSTKERLKIFQDVISWSGRGTLVVLLNCETLIHSQHRYDTMESLLTDTAPSATDVIYLPSLNVAA